MSWTERQRRMLAAMGLRVFEPPRAVAAAAPRPAAADPAPAAAALRTGPSPVPRPAASPAGAGEAQAVVRPRPALPPAPAVAASSQTARPQADPERVQAISALAWQPLQDAVSACTACGLCASRRRTVFGVGHPRAHWMIVGEAPGEQEDLAGEPFVGPAGQLLDQMLRALGLGRTPQPPAWPPGRPVPSADDPGYRAADEDGDPARRVFIANTLKCRPPRNRNPEPEELAACEPFLRRQVKLVQPRLILLMGRFAVKTLLRSDEAIGKLRGRLHRYEGIPVVVTYHPAYLLRNLPDKSKSWADLCFAARTVDAPPPTAASG